MIFDTTYKNKRINTEIEKHVGKPFGLLERFRMKGIGSQKFLIESSSDEIDTMVCRKHNLRHCNIELRNQGLIVRFRSMGNSFAWVIPYWQLNLYQNSGQLSIYGSGHHMKVVDAYGGQIDRAFLKKILELRAEILLQSYEQSGPNSY